MTETWRARLRDRLEDFVDTFVVAGARHEDVLRAIVEEVDELRMALDRDPDPAEVRWSRNLQTTGRPLTRIEPWRPAVDRAKPRLRYSSGSNDRIDVLPYRQS